MWFQVELPQPAMVAEVQFDAGAPGGRGVGGGRGGQRGQRPPAAGAAHGRRAARAASRRRCRPRSTASGPRYPAARVRQLPARLPGSGVDGRKTWGAPVAEGKGSPATTVATFRPVQARFIRVTQTDSGENAPPWSVLNFRVYAVGK